MGAFSTEPKPREDRHIVVPTDWFLAGEAVAPRPSDVLAERHSIDDDVSEAA